MPVFLVGYEIEDLELDVQGSVQGDIDVEVSTDNAILFTGNWNDQDGFTVTYNHSDPEQAMELIQIKIDNTTGVSVDVIMILVFLQNTNARINNRDILFTLPTGTSIYFLDTNLVLYDQYFNMVEDGKILDETVTASEDSLDTYYDQSDSVTTSDDDSYDPFSGEEDEIFITDSSEVYEAKFEVASDVFTSDSTAQDQERSVEDSVSITEEAVRLNMYIDETVYPVEAIFHIGGREPLEVMLVTTSIDFGNRGMKLISFIEVGTNAPTETVEVSVDYRNAKSTTFTSTSWIPLNDEGVAYVGVAGVEFKIKIHCITGDPKSFNLDYLNIKFKQLDKRFIRGAYAISSAE